MDAELATAARDLVRSDLTDPAAARANNRARHAADGRPAGWDRLEVTDRVLPGGVPVRLYRPPEREVPPAVRGSLPGGVPARSPVPGSSPAGVLPVRGLLPAVVWLHGGSFMLGDLDASDAVCAEICVAAGALVVNVDYRLAPEHPCPAALRDAFAALEWVAAAAGELGVDPGRIAVAGSSAGGCLAAGCALLARDRGGPVVAYQLLTYPALDDRCRTRSARETRDSPVIDSESIALMWQTYLAGAEADGYTAPARSADLSRLPPTLIVVAELDPLRDEAIHFATRLRESGVDTELLDVPGTFHGFDTVVPHAAISRRTRDSYLRALTRRLRTP